MSGETVLVVDDDIGDLVTFKLENPGYAVISAPDGNEAQSDRPPAGVGHDDPDRLQHR